jgi:hypothetical protein
MRCPASLRLSIASSRTASSFAMKRVNESIGTLRGVDGPGCPSGRPARFRGGRCECGTCLLGGMDVVDSQVHEGVVPALREIFGPSYKQADSWPVRGQRSAEPFADSQRMSVTEPGATPVSLRCITKACCSVIEAIKSEISLSLSCSSPATVSCS